MKLKTMVRRCQICLIVILRFTVNCNHQKPTRRLHHALDRDRPTMLFFSLVHYGLATTAPAPRTLIYGPGDQTLRLCTAKIAARQGIESALYAGEDGGFQQAWRSLMYGKAYADGGVDAPGNARVLSAVEELGETLAKVQALVLVCDKPLPAGTAKTLFSNSGDELKRVVMVSKMGATRAKPPGPFGIGGEDAAVLASEKELRELSAAKGCDLSIVRVGTLKGGGPGDEELTTPETEAGLSVSYYNTLIKLEEYMCTSAYDKFTLGAKVTSGDTIELANPIMRAARASDFSPFDDETSRVVAAGAVVQALKHPSAVDISVSAAKGEQAPTPEEWATIFDGL